MALVVVPQPEPPDEWQQILDRIPTPGWSTYGPPPATWRQRLRRRLFREGSMGTCTVCGWRSSLPWLLGRVHRAWHFIYHRRNEM